MSEAGKQLENVVRDFLAALIAESKESTRMVSLHVQIVFGPLNDDDDEDSDDWWKRGKP